MHVLDLLTVAARLLPEDLVTAAGFTPDDVHGYLGLHEWDPALDLLVELGDAYPLPADYWDTLADAARRLHRDPATAAWCRWRGAECRIGVVRADLVLARTDEGGRAGALPARGMRPMWDVGRRAPDGGPALNVAAVWIESAADLAPGEHATIRLLPLDPTRWRHLRPGALITLHERRPPVGTALILEVRRPPDP